MKKPDIADRPALRHYENCSWEEWEQRKKEREEKIKQDKAAKEEPWHPHFDVV